MSYNTSIVNLPLGGGGSCQEQHDAYAVEKARVSKLAAQLGQTAANCHKLHGDYESAAAKHAVATEERARCQQVQQEWAQRKAAYDAYMAYRADCIKYLDAKKKYVNLVASLTASNVKLKADWEARKASIQEQNRSLSRQHAGAMSRYGQELGIWQRKKDAYDKYRQSVAGQSYSLFRQFLSNISGHEKLKGLTWSYRTTRCGAAMQCVTRSWKASKERQCDTVRGLGALGATSNADTCHYYYYYPICPDSCPSNYAPHPGNPPTEPASPTFKTIPPEPKYAPIPHINEYLSSQGVKKMPDDCGSATPVQDPGNRPSCNPTAPLPIVPPKPTCTPPEIPAMPIAPTCKPSVFGQVGPMWLLLAAGGAGLYWYAKKK